MYLVKYIINFLKIINILIIFIFSLMLIDDYYSKSKIYNTNYLTNVGYNKINKVHNKDIIIDIPSINLNKNIIKASDNFNNLSNNLVYYNSFNINDKNIIFGHSGLGFGTYFNRIDELCDNDLLSIYKDNNQYIYIFKDKYIINETDTYILDSEENSRKLLLVTCHKINKDKRIVVEFILKCTKSV